MKQIQTLLDLAINGAKPAFEQPLHVGRPNVGSKQTFLRHVDNIFESRWLTNNGPLVQELERRLEDVHKVKNCVAMCNGTVALEIAIRALEFKGEVILPSYTFIATAHALFWQEITPIFADIDPSTHNIDPDSVRQLITPNTSGIIGVHLWGRPAQVEALQEIAEEYQLPLMFDAAHAFGCSHRGQMIGRFGSCEVMSFHATKVFNTFEGGAVFTNDDNLAAKLRLMRNFGFAGFDNVIHPGTNGKMIEVSAAMGLANLEVVYQFIEANRQNYHMYRDGLSGLLGVRMLEYDETESNNFQYVVVELTEECSVSRDEIVNALHAENILARKYFWPGCHNMQPYRELFSSAGGGWLINTQLVSERVFVLPTGATVNAEMIETVTSVIRVLITGNGTH